MVNATVDNTPVTVLLDNGETYTPASGSVQKVTVTTATAERVEITQGSTTQLVIAGNTGSGEPNVDTAEFVITDTETVKEGGVNSNRGVYVSGFEVS